MACPYLEYRDANGDLTFDEARAYCTAADRFVQPLRADICNDRYELEHATHCEIYRAHADGDDGAGDARAEDARADDGGAPIEGADRS
ncbi:hypothetical protein [Halovivax sp.]|uniref:hypothetical protein n=1 Tax=Halovivax sp. TaxID=1935978 RepID=UPI0025BD4744|nr:hypothetical protein [Halovivax sp.]